MASRSQAADLINELWSYFRTTDPPEKSIEVWINELMDIDLNNAGDFIKHKIKALDKWPSNFPGTAKALYYQWRRNKPKAEAIERGCEQCLDGLIHARNEFGEVFVFNCGHCNTSNDAFPSITRYNLAEQGFELDWQHDFKGPDNITIKEQIKKLIRPKFEKREESEPELLLKRLREQKPQIDE